jgi:hypothetical protein
VLEVSGHRLGGHPALDVGQGLNLPDGNLDWHGLQVSPSGLYLAQLVERLGR